MHHPNFGHGPPSGWVFCLESAASFVWCFEWVDYEMKPQPNSIWLDPHTTARHFDQSMMMFVTWTKKMELWQQKEGWSGTWQSKPEISSMPTLKSSSWLTLKLATNFPWNPQSEENGMTSHRWAMQIASRLKMCLSIVGKVWNANVTLFKLHSSKCKWRQEESTLKFGFSRALSRPPQNQPVGACGSFFQAKHAFFLCDCTLWYHSHGCTDLEMVYFRVGLAWDPNDCLVGPQGRQENVK